MNIFNITRRIIHTSLPKRGIDDLWKGGFLDPESSFTDKKKFAITGDAWPSCILRLKSFEDLRSLYFTCLKEKNFLLSERLAASQVKAKQMYHGRLKKVKLTIKRILGVITRREIHQQCLRAKYILAAQVEKEKLETKRFHLLEMEKKIEHKIKRLENVDSLQKSSLIVALDKIRADLEINELHLQPLRKGNKVV